MTQGPTVGKCAEEYVVKRGDSFYLISHKLGVPLRDLLAANRDIHPARLMVGDVLCVPREEDHTIIGGAAGSTAGNTGGNTANNTANTGGVDCPPIPPTPVPPIPVPPIPVPPTPVPPTPVPPTPVPPTPVPPTPVPPTPVPPTPVPPTPPPEPAPNCPIDQQWIIQKGQTAADIQLRNLVSYRTLSVANPDVNLDTLRVGQTICVPTENIGCDVPNAYTLGGGETLESVAVRFNRPVASLLRANPCLAPQDFESGATIVIPI
ncbi:MAG: LysM peptidoglycan-binding domain-containing protein [Clostridia bacterium]